MRSPHRHFLRWFGFMVVLFWPGSATSDEARLTAQELAWIGTQIFRNECGNREACLTAWNEGEAFPSFGIGHFIWYPEGRRGPFVETFPDLIRFMAQEHAHVPAWLKQAAGKGAPWQNRAIFRAAETSEQMRSLRAFLSANRPAQVLFMIQRENMALERLLDHVAPEQKSTVYAHYHAVAETPNGYYILIDYVNFKGEGISSTEQYQGEGWGLLQVLLEMKQGEMSAPVAFAKAAERVLARRVHNAPPERNERQWLPGWKKRIGTYISDQAP